MLWRCAVAESARETVYVDIDDEITGIIDKVRSSNSKIVALVLPKRATVFQSVVNMKLLKRATEQSRKNVVLITTEQALLPMAGAVGLHVADSLGSKPEIPAAPIIDDGSREERVEESASLEDPISEAKASNKPVGELAGLGAAAATGAAVASKIKDDDIETVALDNSKDTAITKPLAAPTKQEVKDQKKLKVPNFERFRLIVILLILALLIGGGIYAALVLFPSAVIHIKTDASAINTSVNLTLSPNASTVDPATGTIPAKQVQLQKTYTATVPATGKQNTGQIATGQVTVTAPQCAPNLGNPPSTVPSGTIFTYNNENYVTQQDATFNNNSYSGSSKSCMYYTSQPIKMAAQSPGAAYNTSSSNTTFTDSSNNSITASGSVTGGTDNIQTIVQQSDIASAQGKIVTHTNAARLSLKQQLQQDNMYPLNVTFVTGAPAITPSANAGTPASNVTVTEVINYSMYGVRASDLKTLLNDYIKSQVNVKAQGILNNGFNSASFTTAGPTNVTSLTMTTNATVGPNINVATIRKQAVGKKGPAIVSVIKNDPNVTNVTVQLSPFWVTSAPTNPNKIKVIIAKPKASSSNNNATAP